MIGKFLFFEEDSEGWKKDSTVEMSMRMPMNPTPPPERSPRERVASPTLSRSEEINTAYGVKNPEMAARLRRRRGGAPRYRRLTTTRIIRRLIRWLIRWRILKQFSF